MTKDARNNVGWEDLARRVLILEETSGIQFTSTQEPEGWKLAYDGDVPEDVGPTLYSGLAVGEAYRLVSAMIRFEKVRQADAANAKAPAMRKMTEGEFIAQAVDDRTEIDRKRDLIVDASAENLAMLAREDFRWQTRQRGVSDDPARREVDELIDMGVDRIRFAARDAFHAWYMDRKKTV